LSGEVALESPCPKCDDERGTVLIESIGAGSVLGWSWLFLPYYSHFDARAVSPVKTIFFYGTRLNVFRFGFGNGASVVGGKRRFSGFRLRWLWLCNIFGGLVKIYPLAHGQTVLNLKMSIHTHGERPAIAVAEPAAHRRDVHARFNARRRKEMTEIMMSEFGEI
jgi:hypothetical protein